MGSTPKSLRQSPPRRFENYVLTRVTSPNVGLVNIPDENMTTIVVGNSDDTSSSIKNIGFDLSFDGITYKRFFANSNGWMVLCGPTETSTSTIQASLLLSASYRNEGINLTNTSQNVLLCPWFDDLRTVASDILDVPIFLGTEKTRRTVEGIEIPPIFFNPKKFGVKMFNDDRSTMGRRLIVRWTCLSNYSAASTVIRFDAVLYENGRIEFRYEPRRLLTLVETESENATIGVFMPGTNRFRDFGFGLGLNDSARQRYIYGGAVYTSEFTDSGSDGGFGFISRPYTWRLKPASHWPGLDSSGGMFVFAPPVRRRKVLPRTVQRIADSAIRLPTVARTGDPRRGNFQINFDDRKTLIYVNAGLSGTLTTGTLVNYPTTLQRFYGDSEPGVVDRQDLFVGDFEFTASLVKDATSEFVSSDSKQFIEPWSEDKIFDNAPNATQDPFFSGSSLEQLGDGLSQPLRSKTQIRLSLPLDYTITMFGISSSVYYYNRRVNTWEIPQNSVTPIDNGTSTMPANSKGDIASPNDDSQNQRIIEDVRGLGPLGNTIASGSHTKIGTSDQTDVSIGAAYSTENFVIAISKRYDKSITSNENYKATSDETFTLPINQPFLIEKAIIELPIAAGDGWFRDKTTAMQPLESTTGSFDIGGPGITVALYNQYVFGNSTRRDLILSGTITHNDDNTSEIVFSNFPPIDTTYQIRQRGFKAFNGLPAAVITPFTSSTGLLQFTGSVQVKCTSMISNGVLARFTRLMNFSDVPTNRSGVLDLFNSSQITLDDQTTPNFIQKTRIAYINNFGRGGSGFDPSGRSVFGKEYFTSSDVTSQGKTTNPFYISGGLGGIVSGNIDTIMSKVGKTQFAHAINSGSNFTCQAVIPLESHKPSPYLVNPGDTLVLAVSKHRPVFYGTNTPTPFTSGAIAHDVKLLYGAINITFYGSMLKEGKEFHDTLNQPLSSDAIHEIVIGNEPVLDQFEVEYKDLYSLGSYDDFIAGSLLKKTVGPDGRSVFIQGERGRVFSKNSARAAPQPGTSLYDFSDSVSFRSQPYFEKVGSLRHLQIQDSSERFWDSLMPDISECFKQNGAGIAILAPGNTIGSDTRVDQKLGIIIFDLSRPDYPGYEKIIDKNWTWSYPFEPRYASITRQLAIEKSFISNLAYNGFNPSNPVVGYPPVSLPGFFFGPAGSIYSQVPAITPASASIMSSGSYGNLNQFWVCDSFINSQLPGNLTLTSSAGIIDISKALFGFGDLNTITFSNTIFDSTGNSIRFGTNHFADFKSRVSDVSGIAGGDFCISPIIRGWKYGVYSGLPAFSKMYFRPGKYGQLRDTLEQRPFTKYYQSTEKNLTTVNNIQQTVTPAAISVKFVNALGKLTKPENTWSQNLSFEATSSVPYFDGETRNRQVINVNTLNTNIISLNSNQFNQITL